MQFNGHEWHACYGFWWLMLVCGLLLWNRMLSKKEERRSFSNGPLRDQWEERAQSMADQCKQEAEWKEKSSHKLWECVMICYIKIVRWIKTVNKTLAPDRTERSMKIFQHCGYNHIKNQRWGALVAHLVEHVLFIKTESSRQWPGFNSSLLSLYSKIEQL